MPALQMKDNMIPVLPHAPLARWVALAGARAADVRAPRPRASAADSDRIYIYRWDRCSRKGQRCHVFARGTMNSVGVEFEDHRHRWLPCSTAGHERVAVPAASDRARRPDGHRWLIARTNCQ